MLSKPYKSYVFNYQNLKNSYFFEKGETVHEKAQKTLWFHRY